MKTLATNDLNDIYLGSDGNLAIASDLAACVMSCKRACMVNLGELPYAQTRGTPFFQLMESKDLSLLEMYLRRVLLTVPGVRSVQSIEFSIQGEEISYTARITTIYGTGTVTNGL